MFKKGKYHFHVIAPGRLRACWHVCETKWKSFVFGWLVANTMAFPLEHALWLYVPPFKYVTDFFHLG